MRNYATCYTNNVNAGWNTHFEPLDHRRAGRRLVVTAGSRELASVSFLMPDLVTVGVVHGALNWGNVHGVVWTPDSGLQDFHGVTQWAVRPNPRLPLVAVVGVNIDITREFPADELVGMFQDTLHGDTRAVELLFNNPKKSSKPEQYLVALATAKPEIATGAQHTDRIWDGPLP